MSAKFIKTMLTLSVASGLIISSSALATTQNEHNKNYTSTKKAIMVSQSNPEFTLKLKSNATTGYSWFLKKYNKNLIMPISQKYVAPSSKLMGAPGYSEWTFKVTSHAFVVPQATKITLIYMQPWNPEQGKTKTFKIVTK